MAPKGTRMGVNGVHLICCQSYMCSVLQVSSSLRPGRGVMEVGEIFLEQRMGNFSERTSSLFINERWSSNGNS